MFIKLRPETATFFLFKDNKIAMRKIANFIKQIVSVLLNIKYKFSFVNFV